METFIREYIDSDNEKMYLPCVKFGVQQFDLSSITFDEKKEAEFICTMFRNAIDKYLEEANRNTAQ